MPETLARVAALGGSAAERGGGYCALCFATRAERRLVSPRHLQHLVELLEGKMASLGPVASALSWGARACAWCEARCGRAGRVLAALRAAARAHALLEQLDTGQDLERQLAAAEAALRAARGAALQCTDVLLIDTLQPVSEFTTGATPQPRPATAAEPAEIETVVIEDDAPDDPAPRAAKKGAPGGPKGIRPLRVTAGAPAASAPQQAVSTSPARLATTRKTVPVNAAKLTQIETQKAVASSVTTIQPQTVNNVNPISNAAVNNLSSSLLLSALSGATQSGSSVVTNVTVSNPVLLPQAVPQVLPQVLPQVVPQVLPQAVPQVLPQAVPQVPQTGDAVLMVLPPGAQIVSRLDGVGPKYLLLNSSAPAAPPGACTVSCDTDSDSNDSISLSELIQRRDEYDRRHRLPGGRAADVVSDGSFSIGNNKCYITDVKSLSEEPDKSAVNGERNYITDVKSPSDGSGNGNKNNNKGKNKRNSEVTRQSKKVKSDSFEEEQARTPQLNTDRVDWEDKIPMDVISFMDATDPRADTFLPAKIINHSFTDISNTQSDKSKTTTTFTIAPNAQNTITIAQNTKPCAQNTKPSAQNTKSCAQITAPIAQNYVELEPAGPRPLALISNVTSATGEKSVVIDLC